MGVKSAEPHDNYNRRYDYFNTYPIQPFMREGHLLPSDGLGIEVHRPSDFTFTSVNPSSIVVTAQ